MPCGCCEAPNSAERTRMLASTAVWTGKGGGATRSADRLLYLFKWYTLLVERCYSNSISAATRRPSCSSSDFSSVVVQVVVEGAPLSHRMSVSRGTLRRMSHGHSLDSHERYRSCRSNNSSSRCSRGSCTGADLSLRVSLPRVFTGPYQTPWTEHTMNGSCEDFRYSWQM